MSFNEIKHEKDPNTPGDVRSHSNPMRPTECRICQANSHRIRILQRVQKLARALLTHETN